MNTAPAERDITEWTVFPDRDTPAVVQCAICGVDTAPTFVSRNRASHVCRKHAGCAPDPVWPDPIPVAEALPPPDPETWRILPDWESVEVLAWSPKCGCGNWHTATYRYEEDFGSSWYMYEYGELEGVTHWLPFPPPPEEVPQ